MASQTSRSTRAPWMIAGVLGCLALCLLLVLIGGSGYFLIASQTSPLASPAVPRATPTLLAEATATTALATQTATPSRLGLSEDFESNANEWNIADRPYTDQYGTFNESIGGGKFRVEVKAIQEVVSWYGPKIVEKACLAIGACVSYANMHLTVDAQRISGTASATAYGIVFRAVDDDNYFLFKVADDQQKWKVQLSYPDGWKTLVDWTESAAIRPGEVNRLEVTAT